MKKTIAILVLLGFCCLLTVEAQVKPILSESIDSSQTLSRTPSQIALDSVLQQSQARPDTTPFLPTAPTTPVDISASALDGKVEYGAKDSINYDNADNKVHLYGDAFVKYQGLELKAGYIAITLDSNIALAHTFVDSIGRQSGTPTFTDGSQNFQAKNMRYNFQTNKGIVYDVATTQSNLFLKGNKTKFVSQTNKKGDSTFVDNILYNKNAIFSTCDAPHPHYGIRSRKQKVVAEKVVVVGLSNLELAGVPTPVWLPFGFFPLKDFKSTGLIFPQGYEYSPQLGFGLDGVGWYFPISEKIDLRLTSQIYWHGTWGVTADSRFKKRYKYSGNLNLSFSSRKTIDSPNRTNSFSLRGTYNQDAKAHPTRTIRGNANIQGNGYQEINRNDAQSVLQATLSSNVSWDQTFPGKPFRLSVAAGHSQNLTGDKKFTLNAPTVNFQMNRIYPFKKERGGNKEKWYEKVSFKYDGQFQNRFIATDTTIFKQETLDNARFGFRHNIATDLNFNLLKYITVSPNASFKEVWYFHSIREYLDTTGNIAADIPATFESVRDTIFGFKPWHEFNTGVSLNTTVFSTLQFKRGRLKGLRHTAKPSLSFNFTPDYGAASGFFGGLIDQYDRDTSDVVDYRRYSILQGGIYGSPSTSSSGRQMALSYSINNIFEAKFRPKRDSVDKKLKIFDNIRVGGSYNFAADSLKFSNITASGTTRLFKGITNFTFNASWTPYAADINNRTINHFNHRTTDGKILRFLNASFRLNTRLSVQDIKKLLKKDTKKTASQGTDGQPKKEPENTFLKFLEGFNLNHSFNFRATRTIDKTTAWKVQTHSINIRIREIKVTDKWSMTVGNIGYDFKNRRTTYPDFGIFRDLHCWRASFNWQPQRGTYYFTIQVKNAPLDVLKLPYQKNNVDAFGGF